MKAQAQRLIAAVSLSLVAAVIAAGVAQADRPDDRAGMLGVGAASSAVGEQPIHPNDRSGMLGVGGLSSVEASEATPVRPDDRDGIRGPGIVASEVTTVTSGSGEQFQWGDAAFGAAAAFSLVLLGAAGMLAVRQRGRVILP